MTKEYDLVVLGGGSGGYVAAIRASQLGMSVALVEAEKLGGTCLHRGCIPTKTLLRTAELFRQMSLAETYGIHASIEEVKLSKTQDRKQQIIDQLEGGIDQLLKKHQIDLYKGYGRILGPSIFSPLPGTISIEYESGEENTLLVPKYVLIATGSKPKRLANIEFDGQYVLSSDQALQLSRLPKSMMIIGGGVIGIEWASLLIDLGVEVSVIESENSILASEDADVQKEVHRQLRKRGVQFYTNSLVDASSIHKGEGEVSLQIELDGQMQTLSAEKLLVSIGREANISDIGLQNTNIEYENGFIKTDELYATKDRHIYAIGDCIGGLQLAHVASKEGIIAVEHMAGLDPAPLNIEAIASNIYSYPEVAKIGLTEAEAKAGYDSIKVGKFPFAGIGKAHVYGEVDGFMKVITNPVTDDILGIHLVGPLATELIGEASVASFLNASSWELSQVVHPHPSLNEIFEEAALAVKGMQIHG